MNRWSLLVVVTLVGCHGSYPEGRYPCRDESVATDCPALWYCRSDNFCWITDDPDGGASADAGDATIDAPMRDTGPHCGAETCNGADDDCDGLIDEGVITVGPAVAALTAGGTAIDGVLLTATPSGFGALGSGFNSPHIDWVSLDQGGRATSTLDRVDGTIYGALDLLAHDDLVATAGIRAMDAELVAFAVGTPPHNGQPSR